MNYYPQYGVQPSYVQPNYYQQQYQPVLSQPQLNGKVVDSVDIVKATEVPIGSFGIYPKADQTEIYLKTWNVDGTTKITTYIPIVNQLEEKTNSYVDDLEYIKKQITDLSKKIDSIKPTSSTPMTRKKREVVDDE